MPQIYSKRKGTDQIPDGAVYVGRGSPWGNPYIMQREAERESVCSQFELHAQARLEQEPGWIEPLRGKDLVCWCQFPSQRTKKRCHAETLLRLARESLVYPQSLRGCRSYGLHHDLRERAGPGGLC